MCADILLERDSVTRFFASGFFHEYSFQTPENKIRVVSNFSKNSARRYSQVKVHHWYQWHRWEICRRCQWQQWLFATGINDTGGKFAPGASDTGGAPWAENISANLKKKFKYGPNGILRGFGETDTWKNLKSKISWHYPFKLPFAHSKLNIVKATDLVSLFFYTSICIYKIAHSERYRFSP